MGSPTVHAQADLQTFLGAELLRAAKHDTSMTDHEKLFVHRCATIEKHLGFSDTPLGRAIEYSCRGLVIGITLYAGKDLGKHSPEKVAGHFKSELSKQAMTSKVFIKHNHQHGTAMAFFINGKSVTADWVRPTKALKILEGIAGEARLIYFKNGQITAAQLGEWAKGRAPQQLMH